MKAVTVTLCPSIDVTLHLDVLDPHDVNRATAQSERPAGKGLNVARALHAWDAPVRAIALVGGDNAGDYEAPLREEELPFAAIHTQGAVRRNLTLRLKDGAEYKINTSGPPVSGRDIDTLRAVLKQVLSPEDFCVFSGACPPGFDGGDFLMLTEFAAALGARLVLDADFLTLEDLGRIRPWLIKPNQYELLRMAGGGETAALRLVREAGARHVLLTRGGEGLVYDGEAGVYTAAVPKVDALCTVAAGDTTLAGFLYGQLMGFSPPDMIRFAAACGTARVSAPPERPVTLSDILALCERVILS